MANKDNQSKQYRIYIKESKSWVDVNKEFYTNYYRDINTYHKRQQEHGRCVCPASKRYLCDMDCLICPYAKASDQLSLDNTVSDSDGNEKSWLDDMPDESAAIAEVLEDAELLRALYAKLNELDPEGRLICQLVMQGKSERDCSKEMGLSRNSHCNQSGIRKNGEKSQNHRRAQTIRGRRNSKCQKWNLLLLPSKWILAPEHN